MKTLTIIIIIILFILLGGAVLTLYFPQRSEEALPLEDISKGNMKILSTAFENNQFIPPKYTCDGEDINPSLTIEGIPENAKSLVLIVDDPDAAMGTFNHWLLWNISPSTKEIKENSVPENAVLGTNNFGKLEYGGPCPPSGVHRYFFKIYALDTTFELSEGAKRSDLEKAMENHILDSGELIGKYQRQ